MIPGMDHCGLLAQTGPGITDAGFDSLTALEKWIEDGVARDSVLATTADKATARVESPGGISPPGAPRTVHDLLKSHGSRCSAVAMT